MFVERCSLRVVLLLLAMVPIQMRGTNLRADHSELPLALVKKIYCTYFWVVGLISKPESPKHSARAARSGHKDLVEILLDLGPPANKGLESWAVLRNLGDATGLRGSRRRLG